MPRDAPPSRARARPAETRAYNKHEKGHAAPRRPARASRRTTGRIEFWSAPTVQAFGYDPLPGYDRAGRKSPVSQPESLADATTRSSSTTGHRLYIVLPFRMDEHPGRSASSIPDPFAVVHPDDAKALRHHRTATGSPARLAARLTSSVEGRSCPSEAKKGVVCVPRPGWRDECPELGLPGYGWDKANGNILVPSVPAEPGYGATPMRSSLCKIESGRGDL